MNRGILVTILCLVVASSFILTGCMSSKILTEKNVNNAMELLLNTEQLSNMSQAKDWHINVVVENEFGVMTFNGAGSSIEESGKSLIKSIPTIKFKPLMNIGPLEGAEL